MKNISNELKIHLSGEVTTIATCWKVTRRDAVVLAFTNHDENLNIDSINYLANSGFTSSAIVSDNNLAVDNLEIEGILDSSLISEQDILAGRYDFAEIEVFIVNYQDLSQGKLVLRNGWFGEIKQEGGKFSAEMRGISEKLSHVIGEVYSPSCRVKLGSTKCGIDLSTFRVSGALTGIVSRRVCSDSSRSESAGHFNEGKITFTSGNNIGLEMEVKSYSSSGEIEFVLPIAFDMNIGDAYDLDVGCDKSFETCKSRFNNAVNFRGEPHVPGMDVILRTAGTRK